MILVRIRLPFVQSKLPPAAASIYKIKYKSVYPLFRVNNINSLTSNSVKGWSYRVNFSINRL
jgi:hypothetical protein